MSNYGTQNEHHAAIAGTTVEAYEAYEDQMNAFEDWSEANGEPDLYPEMRRFVSESDVANPDDDVVTCGWGWVRLMFHGRDWF